jgi:hypothetical protein
MHQISMLYFSGMTEDRELWSGWVASLKKQGMDEPVSWLIKVGKPISILLSQLMTMALPLISNSNSTQKLKLIVNMMEDGDQLEAFSKALESDEGQT